MNKYQQLLEFYQANPDKYWTDKEVNAELDFTRATAKAIPQMRKTLVAQGHDFGVLTEIEGVSAHAPHRYMYLGEGEGVYRCDDPIHEPRDDIDWEHLACTRNTLEMFNTIKAIEELNPLGYWDEHDVMRLTGESLTKAKQRVRAVCNNKQLTWHSRGVLYSRQYRILGYKLPTTAGRKKGLSHVPKPEMSHGDLIGSIFR